MEHHHHTTPLVGLLVSDFGGLWSSFIAVGRHVVVSAMIYFSVT